MNKSTYSRRDLYILGVYNAGFKINAHIWIQNVSIATILKV